MPTVSCPSCSTSQSVDASATSYTCTSCGKGWAFVVCSSCGSRYHAKPGATGWTCPNCGTAHGTAAQPAPQTATPASAVPVSGDDLDAVPPEGPGGPQQPFGTPEPGSAFPMPQADRPGRFPRWGFAAIAVVVVAIVAVFLLTRGGDDEAPGGSAAPNADEAIATMCTDVQQGTQVLRDDALGRAQDTLQQDAEAIKAAGDAATAKQVKVLIARIDDLRTAFQQQAPTEDAAAAMLDAVSALPC